MSDYSLTNDDVKVYMDNRVKIVAYYDLHKYNSIDELLYPYDKVVIMYSMTERNNGHWVCLFRNYDRKEIEFFDSYGIIIDDQLSYSKSEKFNADNHQDHFYLTKLLAKEDKYTIIYNEVLLQEFNPEITTCGRWCLLRLCNTDIDLEDFRELVNLEANDERLTLDEYVTNKIII
jgi:hypothetical protein